MKKNYKEKNLRQNRGITLIALIITIIVLLILAGISIMMLTGENGILRKAGQASEITKDTTEDEQVKLAVADALTDGIGTLSTEKVRKALENEFGTDKVTDTTFTGEGPWTFKGERDTYIIEKTGKITTGSSGPEDRQEADETTSYVGCYADLDGNKEPDGIIYADLAVGSDGEQRWGGSYSVFSYEKEEGLKEYTVSGEKITSSKFGNKSAKMITEQQGTSGNDRFYVMALEDLDTKSYYWYYSAGESSSLGDPEYAVNNVSFEKSNGKTNTEKMIANWNKNGKDGSYAIQNDNDVWGVVQNEGKLKQDYGKEWFVPSRAEWSAFGYMLNKIFGYEDGSYGTLGLKAFYWSSSQFTENGVYVASFLDGDMNNRVAHAAIAVRLSTMF